MEPTNSDQPHGDNVIASEPPKTKKLSFNNSIWKKPQFFAVVLLVAVVGVYVVVRSFASTVAETNVWNTTAEWNAGTLSNVAVANNAVSLAASSNVTPPPPNPTPTTNLALNRPVVASSIQNGNFAGANYYFPAANVNDGNTATRWSSNYYLNPTASQISYANNQWIYVDLGATYNVNEVKLNWEAAYGQAYQIQVSNDAKNWTTIYNTTTGTGGVNDLTGLTGTGRYVRMLGVKRGTQWGYSLWEMGVYGTVASTPTSDLALNKPVTVSSTQDGTYGGGFYNEPASNAVDGNTSTRWSSNYSDPQWIYVDLGATYNISEVKLNWETAYGKAYQIQVSNDATNWTTIYSTTTGTGGINDLTGLSGSGRYVRMYGTVRGTVNGNQWGYSLWEMSVYGTPPAASTSVHANTTPVYNSAGTITLGFDAGSTVSWTGLTPVATTPSGTSITYQARTSSDNSTWSAWSSNVASLAGSRYIQIQASLGTTNTAITPVLSSLTLGYNITVAAPTASLQVGSPASSSATITSGQSTQLTWSSTNATSCTASGAWSGNQATSGSATISPTATSTYGLACSGAGGTSSTSSVTVTVNSTTGGTAPALPSGVTGTFVGSETGAQLYADSGWQKSTNGNLTPSSGCAATSATITVSGTYMDLYTPASHAWDCAGIESNATVEPGHIYQLRENIPAAANGYIADYPSWWTTDAPWDNEIDMAEENAWNYSVVPPGEMCLDIHLNQGSQNTSADCQTEAGGWQIYTFVWNANGNVTMYYNGAKIVPEGGPTASTGTNQHMILWNDNTGGVGMINSTVQVDYLATWTTN